MTIWTYVVIALAVLGGMWCAWALVRGGTMKPAPAPPSRQPRGELKDGFCPDCGQAGVYLTKAGKANLRYHICPPEAKS